MVSTRNAAPPEASASTRRPRSRVTSRPSVRTSRRRVVRRRIRRSILAGIGVGFVWFAYSFGSALNNPAYGTSMLARAAEWGRDNHLGWLVTKIEEVNYSLNPPRKGGLPSPNSITPGTTPNLPQLAAALPPPPRLRSPAGSWLPGEGVWHPAGRTVDGVPAIFTTQVRPDATYTSYLVGVAWMDTRLLRAQLYSGSEVPGGGPYPYTAPISTLASRTLDAAFNAGFKMGDANGGYYTDHKVVLPLRTGAASLVVYRDGSATVGAWGSQVAMTKSVVSVRQNLDLIVNGARPVPGLIANDNSRWGATLGGAYAVWRSGIGVTKDGALVYVGGPSLTITSLASLLVDAGAVRAMELDINTDWVQFSTYRAADGRPVGGANGTRLLGGMVGDSYRYFESWWIRDFYTMSLRTTPDGHLLAPRP